MKGESKISIDNILNKNCKVSEKIKLLKEFREKLEVDINNAMDSVKVGYKYCRNCSEYYKENAFEFIDVLETRNICTFSTGYRDDDIYEDISGRAYYSVCPMGHKTEERFWH